MPLLGSKITKPGAVLLQVIVLAYGVCLALWPGSIPDQLSVVWHVGFLQSEFLIDQDYFMTMVVTSFFLFWYLNSMTVIWSIFFAVVGFLISSVCLLIPSAWSLVASRLILGVGFSFSLFSIIKYFSDCGGWKRYVISFGLTCLAAYFLGCLLLYLAIYLTTVLVSSCVWLFIGIGTLLLVLIYGCFYSLLRFKNFRRECCHRGQISLLNDPFFILMSFLACFLAMPLVSLTSDWGLLVIKRLYHLNLLISVVVVMTYISGWLLGVGVLARRQVTAKHLPILVLFMSLLFVALSILMLFVGQVSSFVLLFICFSLGLGNAGLLSVLGILYQRYQYINVFDALLLNWVFIMAAGALMVMACLGCYVLSGGSMPAFVRLSKEMIELDWFVPMTSFLALCISVLVFYRSNLSAEVS